LLSFSATRKSRRFWRQSRHFRQQVCTGLNTAVWRFIRQFPVLLVAMSLIRRAEMYPWYCYACVQTSKPVRQRLMRQWSTYLLVAIITERLKATQQELCPRTRRLLTSLESSPNDGSTGVYPVLCQLRKMMLWLNPQASGANSWCTHRSRSVDRVMSRLQRFTGKRAQAAFSTAVMSVCVKRLIRRSVMDVASLLSPSGFQ